MALGISLALGTTVARALAFSPGALQLVHAAAPAAAAGPSNTTTISSCADSGPGTLRDAIATAADGATIDLTHPPCVGIGLTSGRLLVTIANLTVIGPGRDLFHITSNQGVFAFDGTGTLTLRGLEVKSTGNGARNGGCVYASSGNVAIIDSRVTTCSTYANSRSDFSGGGAVFAAGSVTVEGSEILDSSAYGSYAKAAGGGIFALGPVIVRSSTVSGNTAYANHAAAFGGGVAGMRDVEITDSLVAGNVAGVPAVHALNAFGGGVDALDYFGTASAVITNSTISGNSSSDVVGGVVSAAPLLLRNSTIAFNTSYRDKRGAIYYAAGLFEYAGTADMQSTIIANNAVNGTAYDLSTYKAPPVTGANNLVVVSNAAPFGTLQADPVLAALADNGGATWTHALGAGSAAIGKGNNVAGLTHDQRGPGFARTFAGKTDIGAFESGDGIFADGFDPP